MNAVNHLVLSIVLISAHAAAQIGNGSFEGGAAGSTTIPAPWTGTAGQTLMFPSGACTSEAGIGLPSAGAKWIRIASGGGAATTSSYAATNNISQTFTTGAAGTQLNLDVAFVTGEGPGSSFNDFLAVSISDGVTTSTLFTLETATAPFPNTACLTSLSATAKSTIVVNLQSIFVAMTPTTPMTLKVHCANGGDNAVTSYAYVDNVFLGTPPPPPIDLNFVLAAGLWTFNVASPTHPGAENWNLFALTLSNPQGTGPIFGINFDSTVLGEILSPLGSQPFHVLLNGSGNYSFGPFAIPPGLAADAVSIAASGGSVVAVSPPKRFTF